MEKEMLSVHPKSTSNELSTTGVAQRAAQIRSTWTKKEAMKRAAIADQKIATLYELLFGIDKLKVG